MTKAPPDHATPHQPVQPDEHTAAAVSDTGTTPVWLARRFGPSDWVPNHPTLPVLIYRDAVSLREDADAVARRFERCLAANGWPPQWRDGIYDYHHYHSTAHEVLGCAAGSARVQVGGPDGDVVRLAAGMALLLPAGTGHRRVSASADFMVVGAYPAGQAFDICRSAATPAMLARIAALPFPSCDPIDGAGGRLTRTWHAHG
ncbi:cupin [Chitinasiproducens palmae]|uniref:Uncharacterized protein YjlB n=1 Tax=Chitinasiproducens palmae TaxID=1770053 RepID=A0A1H2PKY0_9BURK|nr:cupin [Chitinasiproducens palmae]SDV46677.1 Uncharacterized protein YjlB [Chitinasiproducens palmae]